MCGSRARGTNTERSDIDIAVYGGDFEHFYWGVKEKTHSLLMFDIVQEDEPISDELRQEIMRMHGVEGASTGSPREILQLGYKIGFISDSEVWLLILKKRNISVYIYNEDEIILDTPAIGHASHKFYERAGFYRISTEELPVAYSYPDRDSILYLLNLPIDKDKC